VISGAFNNKSVHFVGVIIVWLHVLLINRSNCCVLRYFVCCGERKQDTSIQWNSTWCGCHLKQKICRFYERIQRKGIYLRQYRSSNNSLYKACWMKTRRKIGETKKMRMRYKICPRRFSRLSTQQMFPLLQHLPYFLWGPISLLHNGYRDSFPGVKRPGSDVDHPPWTTAEFKNDWSSTTPLCLHGVLREDQYSTVQCDNTVQYSVIVPYSTVW
jgi:hypothetical protein